MLDHVIDSAESIGILDLFTNAEDGGICRNRYGAANQ